ncbi:MAG TPA: hypothetical protein VIW03_16375, partial [Anaeromyxobacter sp.]
LLAASAARAQPAPPEASRAAAADAGKEPATKDEIRAILEELRRLKLELGLRDVAYQSYAGMGPAASKVYFAPKGLSIGGYGEFTYRSVRDTPSAAQTDLLRLVLYAGYRFNERIVFNSEVEFEHAGHEVSVEFAYLDFLLADALRLRVGSVLVPVGFVNEMHEPPFFNGVFRPDVERRIIPSTWNENGLGVHGEVAGLRYKAYLLTGLDLFRNGGDEPVAAESWVREARSGGAESRAATLAGVLNLDYALGPASIGGSLYRGRGDQRERTAAGEPIRADVTLAEAHAQLAWRGLQARLLGVVGTLGDAGEVNAKLGLPADSGLGSRVTGGYGEIAYDLLSLVAPGGESYLAPFVRLEKYDLNARVPAGASRNPDLDVSVVTAGVTYKPIPTVVVKADWQRRDSAADAPATDQVSFGAGFAF